MPEAARESDMSTHGGLIASGEAIVIIRGQKAARVGDPAVCKGTPDSIAKGEPTVIIGG